MFLDFRVLVGINDILKYAKEFERRILKEERMSKRAKTRSLLQRRPLSSLSGVLLVRFLPTGAENEHQITIQKSKFNKIVYKVTKMCYNIRATQIE